MPTNREELRQMEDEKIAIYPLCDILVAKRRTLSGIGLHTPITIMMNELRPLLRFIVAENEDQKINKLKEKLQILLNEQIPVAGGLSPLLTLENSEEIMNSFADNFRRNKVLTLTYRSAEIERYKTELKERTRQMLINSNNVRVVTNPSGGVDVFLGELKMNIRAGERSWISRLLFQLLSDGEVSLDSVRTTSIRIYSEENDDDYNNYERGDKVRMDFLCDILFLIHTGNDSHEAGTVEYDKMIKGIQDSIRNIGETSQEKLGKIILRIEDNFVFWIV